MIISEDLRTDRSTPTVCITLKVHLKSCSAACPVYVIVFAPGYVAILFAVCTLPIYCILHYVVYIVCMLSVLTFQLFEICCLLFVSLYVQVCKKLLNF